MTNQIKAIVTKYWQGELDKTAFVRQIQLEIGHGKEAVQALFEPIIQNQDIDALEYGLVILFAIEEQNEMIDIVHTLLLEPWHREYEELAHNLQSRRCVESIPFLRQAIQKKYPFLESYETGTRQFINQCGHALRSIGSAEALETIKALSKSKDPIIRDEMLYRLSRIEGRADYQRKY